MVTYSLFIIGFVLLIKGADFLVQGASSLAKRWNISELVIGLTIVAIGTSAPELAVNVISAIRDSSGIALGNILGSNIANILLILGIAICIYPMVIKKSMVYREIPFSLAAIVVLGVFVNNVIPETGGTAILSRFEGIILLLLFGMFMIYTFWLTKRVKAKQESEIEIFSIKKSLLFIALGLVGLVVGGERIVNGAIVIARQAGLSELAIGVSVIAIGTSLPELATSVVAMWRKKPDLAVGNIVGSNIFNILRVLGITAVIHPMNIPEGISRDIWFAIFATMILLIFTIIRKKFTLHRYQGFVMIVAYIAYLIIVFFDTSS